MDNYAIINIESLIRIKQIVYFIVIIIHFFINIY